MHLAYYRYVKVGCQVMLVLHLSYFASLCFLLIINQARWRIVATPCRVWYKDAMNVVMTACIILHNMIVEDEWHDPTLNHDFVFQEDNGTRF